MTELVKCLQDSIARSGKALAASHLADGLLAEAASFLRRRVPAMATVRKYADELEGWVADDLWPLPTYQEMLFIK